MGHWLFIVLFKHWISFFIQILIIYHVLFRFDWYILLIFNYTLSIKIIPWSCCIHLLLDHTHFWRHCTYLTLLNANLHFVHRIHRGTTLFLTLLIFRWWKWICRCDKVISLSTANDTIKRIDCYLKAIVSFVKLSWMLGFGLLHSIV